MSSPSTRLALKEWSAAVHALLDGRQSILLRKGGIHEKAFEARQAGGGFLLFPTIAHVHAERTRSEHRDLIAASADDATEDSITIRAAVHLIGVVDVARPERLPELEDLHIWTGESIQRDRVEFRPAKPLTIMVVATSALPQPLTLPRLPEYGGCTSWIDVRTSVTIPPPGAADGLRQERGLQETLERVHNTVG